MIDGVAGLCLSLGAEDAFLVDTDERKAAVWSARSAFLEAIKASTTEMDECDVVVPRNHVADFVLYTHEVAKEKNIRIPSFGHAGDGNLHVYICRDELSDEKWQDVLEKCFDRMYKKSKEKVCLCFVFVFFHYFYICCSYACGCFCKRLD